MNMKSMYYCLFAGLLLGSCSDNIYEVTDNGVVVKVQNPGNDNAKLIRLQVMGDKLIHVSATPEKRFSDDKSLIVIPQKEKISFDVTNNGDTVSISTNDINAYVLASTGELWFTDKNGKVILQENKGGGKTFTPIEIEGTKGYSIRQVFESPKDEAFYGLGQHQSEEFNYKGKNEELFQYNTKVSIPFIVSNKNYGVLLDSYSLCRFGNPNDYSQLGEVFKLYDKEGVEGAITGTYVPEKNASSETIVRREPQLYFEHLKREDLSKVVNLPENFPFMGANVTYEGMIEPSETGEFKFILYYAGYTKVYIDNKLVVPERWRTAWNPNSYKFSVNLEKGKRVPLKIEWKPDGAVSYSGLRVMSPVAPEEQGKQSWWSEMTKQLDYYFIAGDDMDDVISGYRTLTGKSPIMPKWAMGFWQSREKYNTADEMLGALKGFRDRNIPIDNIVLDWNHWPEDAWGSHEFDKNRFPNPKAMVDSIHAMNAHMMISVWPKFYTTTEHYKEFDKNGWIYQQSVKDSLRDWVGPGYTYGFYDAYDADARKLFWNQMYEHYYPLGIDAWWMDASEPNVRDCTDLQYRKDLCGPTALGPSAEYFNAYALMNAEAIYNGQRSVDNNKRVFLLTRSGFAGLQRYSTATWSGDIGTRWEDMKAQIMAGLNFAISGIPYWTMDIGGFCVENRYVAGQQQWNKNKTENADYKEWRELNARWYQFGAFCPLYRAHGQYPFREIWEIAPEGHPAYNSVVYYSKLRYSLMPYIYSLAGMTWFNDYTIMRPLVMDFTADTNVNNIGDQYMFGPSIMVSPVYKYGERQREVYFPKSAGWYDFYTGEFQQGGEKKLVDAPYERMPLFVRAGSIIPFGPDIQYTSEKQPEHIKLYVYQGDDASFTLYEDEGVNYNYEQGKYSMIEINYDEDTKELVISDRKGEYDGMLKERTFEIVKVSKENPDAFDKKSKGIIVKYDGKSQTVKL